MSEEKERILKLITDEECRIKEEVEDPGIDYAAEYKKQTGKDLAILIVLETKVSHEFCIFSF